MAIVDLEFSRHECLELEDQLIVPSDDEKRHQHRMEISTLMGGGGWCLFEIYNDATGIRVTREVGGWIFYCPYCGEKLPREKE